MIWETTESQETLEDVQVNITTEQQEKNYRPIKHCMGIEKNMK